MVPINKDNTENAVGFLTALHKRIISGQSANITALTAKHNLPQHTSKVLKEKGLVTSAGFGRATVWAWTTIPPNDMMAVELLKKINNYTPSKADKELPPKVKRTLLASKPEAPKAETALAFDPDKDCIETAIDLLKAHGYKIMKPTFIEV